MKKMDSKTYPHNFVKMHFCILLAFKAADSERLSNADVPYITKARCIENVT